MMNNSKNIQEYGKFSVFTFVLQKKRVILCRLKKGI